MNKLELDDVVVLGEDKKEILRIDNFKIQKKEKVGIRGPSGAGKSTFLYLIAGLIKVNQGKVIWDNVNISLLDEVKRDTFRKNNIGMIFQNFFLFEELSAFDNVSIASCFNTKSSKKIVENSKKYLDYFKLKDLSLRSVSSYSGGERQRIAIARALSTNPQVIIADEPTASLDKENAEIIINDLCKLSNEQNKTLIIVSHDEELLKKMDRVVSIIDGRIRI